MAPRKGGAIFIPMYVKLKPILAADWSAPRPPRPTIICCRLRFQP